MNEIKKLLLCCPVMRQKSKYYIDYFVDSLSVSLTNPFERFANPCDNFIHLFEWFACPFKKKLASDWTRAPLHSNGLCLCAKKISIRSNSLPIHSQKISIRSNCSPICSNNLLILLFINHSLSVHFSQSNSFC